MLNVKQFAAISTFALALSTFVLTVSVSSVALGDTTGQYVSDASITTKVKAALLADSQLKSLGIIVETNQGIVQLSGTVKSATDESRAIKTANNVNGVKAVKDLIVVNAQQQSDAQ